MAVLGKEGLTAEAFGITDFQLRHLIDPSKAHELRDLIKQDPAGRAALAKFLPENHPKAGGNGHAIPVLEDIPAQDHDNHEIGADRIDGAIRRTLAGRPAPQVITRRASDITPKPISWLWKYWLARGKLHIIGGVPETGKTTIALAYAAIVSSGATWPDGTRAAVGNVLIWTSEDDPADTLVPRLIRMGAVLDRIHFIEEAIPPGAKARPFIPATDMLALIEKAKAIGDVVLLILDPVVAAMPMTRNSHNNAETRNGMQPVVDFAKAANIATIGISHLNKGTAGKDPLERLNGSGAFGALPRLVMGAAKNEAEGDGVPERIMVRIKSNIGPSGGGFGYHIDMVTLLENPAIEATRIVWEHALEGTAKELLNAAEGETAKVSKFDEAKQFLADVLASTMLPATEIETLARAANVSWASVRRASDEMKIRKFREAGKSWWQLT